MTPFPADFAGSIADCRGSSLWTGSGGLQSSATRLNFMVSWSWSFRMICQRTVNRNLLCVCVCVCVCRINRRCVKHIKQSNDQLKSPSETRLLCVGLKLTPALLLVFSAQETLSLSLFLSPRPRCKWLQLGNRHPPVHSKGRSDFYFSLPRSLSTQEILVDFNLLEHSQSRMGRMVMIPRELLAATIQLQPIAAMANGSAISYLSHLTAAINGKVRTVTFTPWHSLLELCMELWKFKRLNNTEAVSK